MMFYLCRNPDAYAKVAAEVRSVFPQIEDVRLGPKLNSCHYLRACMDESFRMSPSVGSALWREVTTGGLLVDGHFVPPGFDVGTGIYSIHHNPEYFDHPFEYRPERWLRKDDMAAASPHDGLDDFEFQSEAHLARARAAFNPFSIGVRGCVGKSLAINELLLTIASILVEFDFRCAHGLDGRMGEGSANAEYGRHRANEYQMKDYLIGCRNGPMVQFRRITQRAA